MCVGNVVSLPMGVEITSYEQEFTGEGDGVFPNKLPVFQ